MNGFEIIFEKVTVLVLLTLICFASFKVNWLGQEVKAGLQKFIFVSTIFAGKDYENCHARHCRLQKPMLLRLQ